MLGAMLVVPSKSVMLWRKDVVNELQLRTAYEALIYIDMELYFGLQCFDFPGCPKKVISQNPSKAGMLSVNAAGSAPYSCLDPAKVANIGCMPNASMMD